MQLESSPKSHHNKRTVEQEVEQLQLRFEAFNGAMAHLLETSFPDEVERLLPLSTKLKALENAGQSPQILQQRYNCLRRMMQIAKQCS